MFKGGPLLLALENILLWVEVCDLILAAFREENEKKKRGHQAEVRGVLEHTETRNQRERHLPNALFLLLCNAL